MIIAFLIVIIILLVYENWQLYKAFTEPRLNHEQMEWKKVLDMYDEINKNKKKEN